MLKTIKLRFAKPFFVLSSFFLISLLSFSGTVWKTEAAGTISGTVYIDYNMNGVRNTSGISPNYAIDVGVAGVTVTVFAPNGASKSTTTAADGTYSINTSAAPALPSGPYRVEFTNLPAGFEPSAVGSNNATTVRFVPDGNSSNIDLGIVKAEEYCQNNPFLCTQVYTVGSGTFDNIAIFPYNYVDDLDGRLNSVDPTSWTSPPSRTSALAPTGIAAVNPVGATFGLAWDGRRKRLYAASYLKRGARFGALSGESTGAIYRIDNPTSGSPSASVFVDLNAVFGAGTAGANTHPDGTTDWSTDSATISEVGKRSLGGLKLSADGSFLYTVNLADKRLYVIPTSGVLDSSTINRYNIPTTGLTTSSGTCASTDVRPFAVGRDRNGQIYVGAVCSAESTSNNNQLHAYVWRFNGSSFTLVADQALNFARTAQTGEPATWNFWNNTTGVLNRAAPMLTDIDFDGADMILGFRDRYGDQALFPDYFRGYGDIMRACASGSSFVFENNGSCGSITAGGPGTNEGPGGGEYYADLNGDGREEGGWGGLTQVPGYNHVVTTFYDPVTYNSSGTRVNNFYTGGVQRYHNTTGLMTGAYDTYIDSDPGNFGKTNGGGDSEALCDAAPLQIGNLVWNDANANGVQDSNESGIQNVAVQLWADTNGDNVVDTQVGATTTNSTGNYIFGGPNNTNLFTYACSYSAKTDRHVEASSDDAEQNVSSGAVSITGDDLELTSDGATNQLVGVRFNYLYIPQGATITNAYLEFTPKSNGDTINSGNPVITIRAQNADNALTFTTGSNNIGSRPTTTASVTWSPGAWTAGTRYQTANIASVVQEVVNRAGWASGNSMAFILSGSAANNFRRAWSFNGNVNGAPRLVVEYTTSSTCSYSINPNTRYEVRIPSSNFGAGQPLEGRNLSPANNDGSSNGDSRDSDGTASGGGAVISLLTGAYGANNHTFDFGFFLAPTAAHVSVSGQVVSSSGKGLRGVIVYLIDQEGNMRQTLTNSFGYYRFEEVEAGQTVTVSVFSRRFFFKEPTQVISVQDNVTDVNFYASSY